MQQVSQRLQPNAGFCDGGSDDSNIGGASKAVYLGGPPMRPL